MKILALAVLLWAAAAGAQDTTADQTLPPLPDASPFGAQTGELDYAPGARPSLLEGVVLDRLAKRFEFGEYAPADPNALPTLPIQDSWRLGIDTGAESKLWLGLQPQWHIASELDTLGNPRQWTNPGAVSASLNGWLGVSPSQRWLLYTGAALGRVSPLDTHDLYRLRYDPTREDTPLVYTGVQYRLPLEANQLSFQTMGYVPDLPAGGGVHDLPVGMSISLELLFGGQTQTAPQPPPADSSPLP